MNTKVVVFTVKNFAFPNERFSFLSSENTSDFSALIQSTDNITGTVFYSKQMSILNHRHNLT